MLSEQKEFSDDYLLDQDTFFGELKKRSRFPKVKIILLFLIPTIALIDFFCTAVYFIGSILKNNSVYLSGIDGGIFLFGAKPLT